jgi:hypothetical protein
MAKITITNLTWTLAPSVAQICTVSYRLTSLPDSPGNYTIVSTTVSVNPDGSLASPLNITGLANETSYTVKAVNNCGGTGKLQAYTTLPPTCPSGYTLSPDHSYCYRELTTAPTVEDSGICLASSRLSPAYGSDGAKLWTAFNYDVDLNNSSFIHLTSAFWTGSPTGSLTGAPNLPASWVNREGVWVDTDCDGTKDALSAGKVLQFTFLINQPVAKVVYIGVAGDNQFSIRINNNLVAQKTSIVDGSNFTFAHLFPVNLISGPNYINFQAIGDGSVNDAAAIMVLDNNATQIQAATAISDLTYLFRSSTYIGTTVDIATCPAGYVLDTSGGAGSYICRKIETTSIIP